MAEVGTLDFRGFIDDKLGARAGGRVGRGTEYAYISDKTTAATFERIKPVEVAVTAAVRLFKDIGKNELLGHAVKVGPQQFPRVQRLAERCAETLGIATPTLYIVNSPVMNAATYGTNEDSFIMIHSGLIDHFSDEELLSVIGHECGHIHNSHVVYLTAMHYVTQMASMFVRWAALPARIALLSWSRRAEITCDRAGLLCCGDLGVSTRALTKLALGSSKLYEELNMEAFVDQYKEGRDSVGRFAEIGATHPWLPKRVVALRAFAESEVYLRHLARTPARGGSTSAPRAAGLSMDEVDERVHGVIKIVG